MRTFERKMAKQRFVTNGIPPRSPPCQPSGVLLKTHWVIPCSNPCMLLIDECAAENITMIWGTHPERRRVTPFSRFSGSNQPSLPQKFNATLHSSVFNPSYNQFSGLRNKTSYAPQHNSSTGMCKLLTLALRLFWHVLSQRGVVGFVWGYV